MRLPAIPAALAKRLGSLRLGSLDRKHLPLMAAAGGGVIVFGALVGITLFGSAEDAEPKQVIKIDRTAASHGTGGPLVAQPTQPAAVAVGGLTAVNGIVISDPALLEASNDGPLPRIAADGRKPMDVYARVIDRSDPRPKVALIVGGLGLGEAVTAAAVDRLPPGVTLAFTPYGSQLQAVVSTARAKGHEVLLEVPLEPYDYPDNDPGQNTLLTGTSSADNPVRLRWVLSRVAGYAGLINAQGAKFLSSSEDVRFLMDEAKGRGLYLVDSGESEQSIGRETAQAVGAAFARADVHVDATPTREAIEKQLESLEALAKQRGIAVGFAGAIPVTIDRASAWAAGLEERGISLVPVSALTVTQTIAATAPTAEAPAAHGAPKPQHSAPKPRPTPAQQLPTNPEPAFETPAPHP